MTDIRRLDDATVDRIAAGEVVERPASVVKELVENSVDADADRIDVTVESGGTDRIEVRDDGAGMSPDDLELAVTEHATSKIHDIDDLEGGVASLGFRGEALHAIGAVSTLTVRSREQGAASGAEIRVDGGEIVHREPVGCPEGTTVVVEGLFDNVPARRKYLKSESTEFSRVNGVVSGYALANAEIAVSLTHSDRETFATEGRGDRRAAVMAVYGRDVATNMVPVEGTEEPGPLDDVGGLVSHPETNRATREYVNVFVNGRWVTANAVRDAIVEAYDRQLAGDRYPFAVVDLAVDPATVDVNVHPRKLEVRFADADGMARQVRDGVASALLDAGLLRTSAPRGRSKAAQTEISPGATDTATTDGAATRSGSDPPASDSSPPTETASVSPDRREWQSEPTESDTTDTNESHSSDPAGSRFRDSPDQTTFDGSDPTPEFDQLPSMRVLDQLHDTYVVAETDDGLVLIDQHAADERVNFERLRERFAGDVVTQTLAEPVDLSLTGKEAALAEPASDVLARLGFTTTLVEERTLRVSTVPALLADAVDWPAGSGAGPHDATGPELVRSLIDDFADGDPERTVERAVDDLLGDLACYPSVTGNTSLTEGSLTELLAALDGCENPYACPHGRPVVIELSREEIENRFERDYPGHG